MNVEKPVLWSQGLFLLPQHFQLQDRYHEAARTAQWRLNQTFGWGVESLELTEEGLAEGIVNLHSASGVTRDGVPFELGGEGANAVVRPLPLPETVTMKGGDVVLCLARPQPGVDPILRSEADEAAGLLRTRFVVDDRQEADAFDPEAPKEGAAIRRLKYLFQLIAVRPEDLQGLINDFDTLRIGRLEAPGGRLQLKPGSIPPCLSIGAIPRLNQAFDKLREAVIDTANDYAEQRRERGLVAEVGTSQDLTLFLILTVLNRCGAALSHLLENPKLDYRPGDREPPRAHPHEGYRILREVVAELAALSPDYSVFGSRPSEQEGQSQGALLGYNHDALEEVFERGFERAHQLLSQLSTGPAYSVELVHQEGGTWAGEIPPDFFEGRLPKYFLVVESNLPPGEIRESLQDRKIGPPSELNDIIDRRLLGLSITRLDYPPEQLPQRSNRYTYFEIDQTDFYWTKIKEELNIRLYCPELDRDNTRVKLVKTLTTA